MKRFVNLILILLLCVAVRIYPQEIPHDCYPTTPLVRTFMHQKMAYRAKSITSRNEVYQFFINQDSRAWAIIAIDTNINDRACVIATGVEWLWPGEISL